MTGLPRLRCGLFEDEPDWSAIAPNFLKHAVTGAEPRQITSFKTAWNPRDFRVWFDARDTAPRATMTQRDAPLYEEEVVELFLDPIGDLESYFEIEVNPLNAVCDLVLRRTRSGYRKCLAWDCEGLRTTVKITAEGWLVDLAIPFASLGPELPRDGMPWRANFCRIDRPRHEPRELSAWAPAQRPNFHVPSRFGWIDFAREPAATAPARCGF